MSNPPLTPAPPPASTPPSEGANFDISEEYGTARKSLPPARIVLICLAVVVAIATIYSVTHRAHPPSTGSVDDVAAVAFPGQNMVMVAVNVSLLNNQQSATWIKAVQVATKVGDQDYSDDASPAVDAQRYFQSMPELKQHSLEILTPEARINPGEKVSRTIVVSFPVTAEAFAGRKSLTVTITPYDQVPIVLTK